MDGQICYQSKKLKKIGRYSFAFLPAVIIAAPAKNVKYLGYKRHTNIDKNNPCTDTWSWDGPPLITGISITNILANQVKKVQIVNL